MLHNMGKMSPNVGKKLKCMQKASVSALWKQCRLELPEPSATFFNISVEEPESEEDDDIRQTNNFGRGASTTAGSASADQNHT